MSFADDLSWQGQQQGVAIPAVNMFAGSAAIVPSPTSYPSSDATKGAGPYLVITETGGPAPTRVQNNGAAKTKRPSAQILAMAASPSAALKMIQAAYAAFDGTFNATLNGTFYLSLQARQEPFDMGFDATGNRQQYAFNVIGEYMAS